MAQFIGIHEVKDYDHWKEKFDEDNSRREEAGMRTVSVTRGHANANEVCVIFDVDNAEVAQAFANSPELKEKMEAAGVLPGGKLFVGSN